MIYLYFIRLSYFCPKPGLPDNSVTLACAAAIKIELSNFFHIMEHFIYSFSPLFQIAEKNGITEAQKATGQMAWVGAMNSIRTQVEEIVYHTLICSE